jgi:hypothetical protein
MKFFTLVVAFMLSAVAVSAQQFEFTPDTIYAYPDASIPDAPADVDIHNLLAVDQTIRWQRNVLFITPGCATKVCDLIACYPENFSTREFVLPASAQGLISVHLVNPTANPASAAVRLDMWNVDDPSVIIPAYFIFNVTTSLAEAVRVEKIHTFPNPTTNYFQIENDEVARIRVVNMDGRDVSRLNAVSQNQFDVTELTAGNYTLLMEDASGKIIGISQLTKL